MGIRVNVSDKAARDKYIEGCLALDQNMTAYTKNQVVDIVQSTVPGFSIPGPDQNLSAWDLVVVWHLAATAAMSAAGRRNLAHGGPIFLPWHRHYMITLERMMQDELGDPSFAIPYWDWAADGELPASAQLEASLWGPSGIGEPIGSVTTSKVAQMRVRVGPGSSFQVRSVASRPLRRRAAQGQTNQLPRKADVTRALQAGAYGASPWASNTLEHRGILEGYAWNPPALHNLVHVWIGGDMAPMSSPNDPVFFLNHCNVDRIWEAWMKARGRSYSPGAGEGPAGHRVDSLMFTLLGENRRPSDVLDASAWYSYDSLQVD